MPRIDATVRAWHGGSPDAPASWQGMFKHGDSAWARNELYTSMALQLEPNRGRYWFEAAGMVTGRGGIKSLEGKAPAIVGSIPLVGSWLHVPQPGDLEMLIKGNAFLFPYNMHNWYRLREKSLHVHQNVYPVRIPGLESSWGVELERALVVLEQSLVQQWLDTYPWASSESKAASLRRISNGFGGPFTNAWLKEALDKSVGVSSFDFGNLDHRIGLGFEAVRRLRGEGL